MAEENGKQEPVKTEVQIETKPIEPPKVEFYRTFTTQEDFDNETAKIRGTAERKAKNELLKQLGIDSEDKLEAIKNAYQNSLTEQDKINEQLKQLDTLKAELAENKAIITALSKTSNKPAEEITKLVKMAKGLVSEDCTIEQALDEVINLIGKKEEKPQIPTSQVVTTIPDNNIPVEENPFKTGNIDGMMKLIKENPEKAKQLAKLANYPINF
jgi:hypothetical protein